jgi:hypothetical protein
MRLFAAVSRCLLVFVSVSGCSTADRPEELRTIRRRITEIDGEVANSCQILAYAANHSPDQAVRERASDGLFQILGMPDLQEVAYANSLDLESVEPVIGHGLALLRKREELSAKYLSAERVLATDFHRHAARASAFGLVKFLAIGGGLVFLLFGLGRRL